MYNFGVVFLFLGCTERVSDDLEIQKLDCSFIMKKKEPLCRLYVYNGPPAGWAVAVLLLAPEVT